MVRPDPGALQGETVYPRLGPRGAPDLGRRGGSPESVVRVVRHDLQLMLAIIGGDPLRFRPFVDLYHRACASSGARSGPSACTRQGFVPRPTRPRARRSGRTTRRCSAASAASGAGRR
jgi:hypothetical protein